MSFIRFICFSLFVSASVATYNTRTIQICDVSLSGFSGPEDPTFRFTTNGPRYKLSNYNAISFNSFYDAGGDVEGRLAVRYNFSAPSGGFTIGYQLDVLGADSSVPFGLVVGKNAIWNSGSIFPEGTSQVPGPKENIWVGNSFTAPNYLQSRKTGGCNNCLETQFNDAKNYYTSVSNAWSSKSNTATLSLEYGGVKMTCASNSASSYVATINSADWNQAWYFNTFQNCNPNAQYVFNIAGTGPVVFQGGQVNLNNPKKILWNIPGTGRLITISNEVRGSILAPGNTIYQPNSGVIKGIVIAGNIQQVLQINWLHCDCDNSPSPPSSPPATPPPTPLTSARLTTKSLTTKGPVTTRKVTTGGDDGCDDATTKAVTSGRRATTGALTTKAVTSSPLTTRAVTSSPLTTRAVTSSPLTTRAVTSSPLTTRAVTSSPLTTRAVTSSPLTTRPATSALLTTGEVTSSPLSTGEVTSAPLTTGEVTSAPLSTQAVTSAPLTTQARTSSPLTTRPITSSPLTTRPLTTSPLTTSPITSAELTTSPVTTAEVTSSPITSSEVTSGPLTTSPITSAELTTSPVTSAEVTSSPLTTSPITSAEVTSSPLTTSPVTSAEVTSSPLTTSPITSAEVTSSPLTTSPLTTSPITSAEVTSSPLTTSPITSAEVTTSPLTTSPITSAEVTSSPLTTSPITSAAFSSSPLTTSPITSAELTTSPLSTSEVTSGPLTTSPITSAAVSSSPLTTSPITTSELTTSPLSTAAVTSGPLSTAAITSGPLSTAAMTSGPLSTAAMTSGPLTTAAATSGPLTTGVAAPPPEGQEICYLFFEPRQCEGFIFDLENYQLPFADYDVISFASFYANTGDTEGRVAVRDNFVVGGGFSVGALVDNMDENPVSLIVGRDMTWGSGALLPIGTVMYVGGNRTAPSYLTDLIINDYAPGATDSIFDTVQGCYEGVVDEFAAVPPNTQAGLLPQTGGELHVTCNSNTTMWNFVSIDAVEFNQVTFYTLHNCAEGSTFVITIGGTADVQFRGFTFPNSEGNLYVIPGDRNVDITVDVNGSILAPNSVVEARGGAVWGKVVAADIPFMIQFNRHRCIYETEDTERRAGNQMIRYV